MKQSLSIFISLLVFTFLSCTQSINKEKTFVAWVSLTEINPDWKAYMEDTTMEGSVITLQDGDRYDGIYLSAEEGGKWVAGSEDNKRTNIEKGIPVQESDYEELIQLAIVYTESEIFMYKNGELKSSYAAENIDLLSSDKNYVLFGMDHFDGIAHMSEAIEDVRIYDRALTEAEIKSLQPNEASKVSPYAWWNFEDDKLEERTGKFTYHNRYGLTFKGFELKDGKLFINMWGHILGLRDYVPETPVWPENPPENWLTFHLAHPGPGIGNPGDPNPAYFYKGRYHMHYIYKHMYGFAYAHISSEDMVHWKWHPTVLSPPVTGTGMYSGTGFFTKEGKPAMIYHGVGTGNMISYALDDNLDSWSKADTIVAKDDEGKPVQIRYWDPDLWLLDDTYYALSGGNDPGLMTSDDLKNWNYKGKLFHDDYPDNIGVGRDEDVSCANMFMIGNKWMLLCISHDFGCRYFLGDFKDGKYLPEFHAKMNWQNTNFEKTFDKNAHPGLVYFAPESMLSEDGRRVMRAWLITKSTHSGIQSLPRELELPEDGVLRIKPLTELEKLRYDEVSENSIAVVQDKPHELSDINGDALEIKVTISAPLPDDFGIKLLGDNSGNESLTISADKSNLKVGNIDAPLVLEKKEDLTLRIFIDKNIVEVFANDRQGVAVEHEHIRKDPNVTIFTHDKDLLVTEIRAWKMRSIYK
jgi:beta-fructofuranosidase